MAPALTKFSSPGTLAPPMLGANDTMDVIFATHWIYPSRSPVLQPDDKKCIESTLEQRTGDLKSRAEILNHYVMSISNSFKGGGVENVSANPRSRGLK